MSNKLNELIEVLIVEDNDDEYIILERLLRKRTISQKRVDFNIARAESKVTAIQLLKKRIFQVVLLDLNLPDSTGIETFKTLLLSYPSVPFIILTNNQDEEVALNSVSYGAQDYHIKAELNGHILEKSILYSIERRQILSDLDNQKNKLHHLVEEKTIALRKAKEKAESANKIKTDLLANVSHELRTPLHLMMGYNERIQSYVHQEKYDKKKLLKYTSQIQESGDRLLTLIENLLNLSKIQLGDRTLNLQKLDLDELINKIIEDTSDITDARNLTIKKNYTPLFHEVVCDSEKIYRLILNLFYNAIKFSIHGENITINIQEGEKTSGGEIVPITTFSIFNFGNLIPKDDLESIFERFKQSSDREAGGTGLGLSIAKEIAEMHNGEIRVQNKEKGVEFSFHIPTNLKPS